MFIRWKHFPQLFVVFSLSDIFFFLKKDKLLSTMLAALSAQWCHIIPTIVWIVSSVKANDMLARLEKREFCNSAADQKIKYCKRPCYCNTIIADSQLTQSQRLRLFLYFRKWGWCHVSYLTFMSHRQMSIDLDNDNFMGFFACPPSCVIMHDTLMKTSFWGDFKVTAFEDGRQ